MPALLQIENLQVEALPETPGQPSGKILRGVDLSLADGERWALVGESGCGKTVTALSILRLLPEPPLALTGGRIIFQGRDLSQRDAEGWRRLRGGEIGMIFQDPLTSLNPAFRVGEQVAEAITAHRDLKPADARAEVLRLFRETGLPDPERVADQHPHQLSGGMCQRVMIAQALAGQPSLLIADEPTTALDVTVQAQILDLLRHESENRNLAVLLVTHDLALAAGFADQVAVFYAGRVVERGPVKDLLEHPAHPYTKALWACRPTEGKPGQRLPAIEGAPPTPYQMPTGCSFAPRCPSVKDRCRQEDPGETEVRKGQAIRCFYPSGV